MSIYKRKGSPFWQYKFELHGRRYRGSTETGDKRAASAIERQKRAEVALALQAATEAERPPLTWGMAAARFHHEVGQHYRSADAVATCARSLVWLTQRIGYDTPLTAITDDRMARLVAQRRGEGVGPATVNRTVTEVARKVLRRADLAWRCAVPSIRWAEHMLAEPRPLPRPIAADVLAALDAAERDDWRPAFRFADMTGARRIELVNLQWNDVDFGRMECTLTGKGGRQRTIPMTPEIRDLLWSQRGHHPQAVFTYAAVHDGADGDGNQRPRGTRVPITLSGAKTRWRRTRKAQGVQARFHDRRHTFAIDVLRATGNLRIVQNLLGHASIETTTIYAHAMVEDMRAAMAAAQAQKTATQPATLADKEPAKALKP